MEMRAPWTTWAPPAVLMLLLLAAGSADGYKPVIIVHGIFDGPKQFADLSVFIKKVGLLKKVRVVNLDNLQIYN